MLQIDHTYEFFYHELFNDFMCWHLFNGVPKVENVSVSDISVFTRSADWDRKIFFYDQEPFIPNLVQPYLDFFVAEDKPKVLVTSEQSNVVDEICKQQNLYSLYYFFHGFAALDWYRGYYALNYNKNPNQIYLKDYISFNRLIKEDRSYRIYFISLLKEHNLLSNGLVSFGVTDDQDSNWRDETSNPNSKLSTHAKEHIETHLTNINKLVIDHPHIHGSASASIPTTIHRHDFNNDTPDYTACWHVVTETVFYYDKLHLTEKIFKPIVSKQPFILLAGPTNLEYLRKYGFKTFDGIIDESYDKITNCDLRTEAVVIQLQWYCNLSLEGKQAVIEAIAPIVEYNFHHFYGEFKHIITRELLDNTKTLFKEIGYNDSTIAYDSIYRVLTN